MAGDPSQFESVAAYKRILETVIDRRPSGTRQRLATALAKNRSFISQIANSAYPTPIPANHLDVIFEICHFSAAERRQFLEAYQLAHPKRLALPNAQQRTRAQTVHLPDLGDRERNERLHAMVADFVGHVARLLAEKPGKGKRK